MVPAFLALVLALTQPPPGAALVCLRPVVELGEVRAGPPLRQRFILTNRGPDTLALTATRTSCHCLEPRLSPTTLPPGASAELELEVNTLSPLEGHNAWRVSVGYRPVGSAEPEQTLELRIQARLVRELTIEPAALRLRVAAGATHDVTITDRRAEPLRLTDVRTTSFALRAELLGDWRGGPGAWVRQVRLTVAETAAIERDEALLLYADDPVYREIKLGVTLEPPAGGGVTAVPAEVTFRPVAGQAVVTALVRLRDATGRPVRVAAAEADQPQVECLTADGPGAMSTLKLRCRGAAANVSGSIRVRLREPDGLTVTIPWRVETSPQN